MLTSIVIVCNSHNSPCVAERKIKTLLFGCLVDYYGRSEMNQQSVQTNYGNPSHQIIVPSHQEVKIVASMIFILRNMIKAKCYSLGTRRDPR